MTEPYIYRMTVRFADTDLQGHVYFANYLTFCDEALGGYMKHIGVPWQALADLGVDMFYRSSSCEHSGSVTYDDQILIEAHCIRIGNTSMTTEYTVRAEDGTEIAKAKLTGVCVDPATRKPARVPDELRDAIRRHEGRDVSAS